MEVRKDLMPDRTEYQGFRGFLREYFLYIFGILDYAFPFPLFCGE
jgi:hypothetical protein